MSIQPIQGCGGKLTVGGVEVPLKEWHATPPVDDWNVRYLNSPRNKRNLAWISHQAANLNPGPRIYTYPMLDRIKAEADAMWERLKPEPVEQSYQVLSADVNAAEFDRLWKEAGG